VLLVCLALLILLGNGLLIALPFSAKNESSLRLAIQNSAPVPSGLTPPANPYKAATSGTPIIDDPLTAEDALEWNNVNGCSYRQGALHASSGLTNGEAGGICTIFSSSYTNIAFQVQVILDQGSLVAGGMVFRNDFTTGQGYMFDITNQGEVFLMLATTNSAGSVSTTMLYDSQHNAFVHSQLYQANLLTVIAEGNLLSLYVNQHLITHVTNATSPSGSVGVMCLSGDGAPSDAAFHSAQLWLL
jgi:hypothetical protein